MTKTEKTLKIKIEGVKMSDQNSFHFIGRLTRPAELKYIGQNNTACATFALAVNRWNRAKDQEDVSFFDFSYYGQAAANIIKYLEKGKQISVKGFCKQDRWEKDGEKHSKVSFIVTELQFLGGSRNGDDGTSEGQPKPAELPAAPSNNLSPVPETGYKDFEEDIPF